MKKSKDPFKHYRATDKIAVFDRSGVFIAETSVPGPALNGALQLERMAA